MVRPSGWRHRLAEVAAAGLRTVGNVRSRLVHPTTVAPYFHPAANAALEVLSPFVLDRDDLERRFRENGSIERYGREREVAVTPPVEDPPVSEISDAVGTFTLGRPFVGALENARLVGSYPVPLDRNGKVVLEAVVSPPVLALNVAHSILDFVGSVRSRGTPSVSRRSDPVESAVLLYNRWNRGYFHWTTETLTCLEGVETYRERTGETPKLVVGPDPTRFQIESLELLGYGEDDLIRWDCHEGVLDRLVVPSSRRQNGLVAHRWLRERMRSAAASETPDGTDGGPTLVYVSREDADYRRVLNEPELLDVLEAYGFEKYVLSERSVAADVDLFARADVVVAPHGAGLTNVVYSEDVTVVELFRSNYVQPVYFLLSKQLGHRYRYLTCDYEGTDLVVDVDELEAVVTRELAHRNIDANRDTAAGSRTVL